MTPFHSARGATGAFAALAGSLLGAALQLRQSTLWPWWIYAALLLMAGGAALGLAGRRVPLRWFVAMAFACGVLAGGGHAGWRAVAYVQGALLAPLEGRDLQVTGMVAEMPQRSDGGTRFRLDVESARWTGPDNPAGAASPVVPDRIALGWYDEGLVVVPHAGERWRLTVRLKAPHGHRNPHGFDSELWMWEQGLHASGYVRTGTRDEAPAMLQATWRHPVERAREAVRDAVFARVPERAQAGVIAALVTGDQSAIDLLSYKGVVTPRNSAFRGKTQSSAPEATKGVLFPRREHIWVVTNDVLFPTFFGPRQRPSPKSISFICPLQLGGYCRVR